MRNKIESFHVIDQSGRELNRLNLDVMFYINKPFREIRDEVIQVMESFFQILPKENISWYLTETMKQYKPASKRSFTLPKVWWRDGAPKKALRELKLKGCMSHDSVATCGINLSSAEREDSIFNLSSNYIRFIVPPEYVEEKRQIFVDFVISACNTLPFTSGHCGYVIECNEYFAEESQGAAYPLAMRYQGVDISTMSRGPWAVRAERIKNVAWLTLVGSGLLEKIGGLEYLHDNVSNSLILTDTAHGVVIQAGEKPILGDVNRCEDMSALIDAYKLVGPLQAGIETLFAPFELPGTADEVDATERWLFRFAEKGA